ncbi:transcription factor [Saccharomycopsis crataegensis]|uniref:Transcription factor MBP1 n=1 Tax=Saccharomycopsis crataegensis TaxID=43959 RepID=A0AAV5QM57_9ASCO|nr:transcription factor [Saccharomycopsis crataegensis]
MSSAHLYSATYSNVPVYEFLIDGSSVMRRKSDDWVNATHILKAASFAKAKRTRILEKEVQTGSHEKVQGGYGKYQGTWIPMEDARQLAERFDVYDKLAPILEHTQVDGDPEPPIAPKHHHSKTHALKSAASTNNITANKRKIDNSRSLTGSPSVATRSNTFPTLKRKSKFDPDAPPKKRGRPKRVDTTVVNTPVDSAVSSILESGTEQFDILRTFDDKVELNKNGLPKKKRGRKPKPKPVEEDITIMNNNTINNNNNTNTNNTTFQTPVKASTMNSRLIRSFVNEKSSPLNENDLNTYFNTQLDNGHHGVSSDVEEEDERAAHLRRMLENDPSSSPSDFMSDTDLARVLKSPENLNGLGIEASRLAAKDTTYTSFINNKNSQYGGGYFSSIKTDPRGFDNELTPIAAKINNNNNINNNHNISTISIKQSQQNATNWFDESDEFTKRLINYFMRPDDGVNEQAIPEFLIHLPKTFYVNKVIDPEGNTALHWACAMGNLPIIELLLRYGADHRAKNKRNEIPLTRTVRFNNSFGKRTFSKILDVLRDTIFEVDTKGRTLLHHIGITSNSPQKANSSRYYSEMLLAKIRDLYPQEKLPEFINMTDRKGNTALYYAVYNQARKLVKVLLSYGAKSDITNLKGQSAGDLLVLNLPSTPKLVNSYKSNMRNLNKIIATKKDDNDTIIATPPAVTSTSIEKHDINTTVANRKIDLNSLAHVLQSPKYSEVVISSIEKTAISLMEQLNSFSELYDNELQKKQVLIYDLNKYYNELNFEINNLDKNVINSSIAANQLLSSALSDAGGDDYHFEEEGSSKSELAKKIINTNHRKLYGKITKQHEILVTKISEFEKLLCKIQTQKLTKEVDHAKKSGAILELSNDSSIELPHNSAESKIAALVEISKLQIQREKLTKKILSNFIIDSEIEDPQAVPTTSDGDVEMKKEIDDLESIGRKEKSKKISLYRRLVAACCDIGIDKVDELIDTILESLSEKQGAN